MSLFFLIGLKGSFCSWSFELGYFLHKKTAIDEVAVCFD
jgi:hypothetical protein